MIVGVPKEIKNHEYRVALVPAGVHSLVADGHTVLVERSAGEGSGISDAEFAGAGAQLRPGAEDVFAEADLIVKVKEPLPEEYPLFHEGQVLFSFLHLAPNPELTAALLEQRIIGIACETVQLENGSLPLLIPMSEVAGRLSIQVGAHYLEKANGGSGILLEGVPGTPSAQVAIVGGGTVGTNAARIALGMGASVTVLDVNLERLRHLADSLPGRLTVLPSNDYNLKQAVAGADLVVGALLVPGARAKKIITRAMMAAMRPGSVIVDVAIDQGGCVEGAVPTTHDDPVYTLEGVTLYCVSNLPATVPRTSTLAFTNATLPYVSEMANLGPREALAADPALWEGLNVCRGKLALRAVAEGVGMEYTPCDLADL
jgi:alanine dehydrogenase